MLHTHLLFISHTAQGFFCLSVPCSVYDTCFCFVLKIHGSLIESFCTFMNTRLYLKMELNFNHASNLLWRKNLAQFHFRIHQEKKTTTWTLKYKNTNFSFNILVHIAVSLTSIRKQHMTISCFYLHIYMLHVTGSFSYLVF